MTRVAQIVSKVETVSMSGIFDFEKYFKFVESIKNKHWNRVFYGMETDIGQNGLFLLLLL